MSKQTDITAIWPDGTEQVVSVYRVMGMKRIIDGKHVRPVFVYGFDLEAVEPKRERESIRRRLRQMGAAYRGQTEWAKAADAPTPCEPVTEWADGRPLTAAVLREAAEKMATDHVMFPPLSGWRIVSFEDEPSGTDAESGSNAPPVACPASPEEACPIESSGPA